MIETLKKRDSLTKSFGKISHDELKVILNDITPPKTNSLIKMMDATHYDSALHKTQSQSGFKNSSIDTRISTTNTPNETAQGCNASINYFFQTEAKKASRVIFSKALETKEIEWDENFEEKFKKYIAEGRNLFFNEMKNAKFYEIGVMYMMKELFKEEKNNLERTAYMDAYADGAHLTNEELRFLADTSDLLNSCVDKNYIKKVVNLIDPNILHYVIIN